MIEELNTRSMRIQTRSSSKHLTFAAHTPHAISAESVVRSTQILARARIASRSGVGVGVGTASTTAKRSFDDDSPRMSQLISRGKLYTKSDAAALSVTQHRAHGTEHTPHGD